MKLPVAFIDSLTGVKGFDKESFESVHQSGEQVTSIRLNPYKPATTGFSLSIENKVAWSANGYYLSERPSFTLDPLFHAGVYYVQEASSMFLEEALKQSVDLSAPLRVLDLCAAPGGKSTLIQSLISKESLLVSNEVIKSRVTILSENIIKWGAANVIVTNNDPKDFQRLENYFDVIIVDAPCSGSGLFRKDNDAINEWSEENVNLCSQRQKRILADVLPALKENGVLIYSTCSYSKEEDEETTDWLLKNYPLSAIQYKLKGEWNIIETISSTNGYGYRFYPDKLRGEGFFIAGLRKLQGTSNKEQDKRSKGQVTNKSNKFEKIQAREIDVIKPYLKDIGNLFFIKLNDEIITLPLDLSDDFFLIQSSLYVKKAGIKVGKPIRDELIPDYELALSTIMSVSIPSVEVDEETALKYLRRSEFRLDVDFKGWALIKFKSAPLGWIKILPGRINNYYPKEWRILNK